MVDFYRPSAAPVPRSIPSTIRCPACKQPFGDRLGVLRMGRTCVNCNSPILRHDKFTIAKDGLRHRNCDDPESYT